MPMRMPVRFLLRQGRVGQNQLAFLNPFQPANSGGELAQFAAFAAEDDHFHAVIVVEMDVGGGHDEPAVIVLNGDQLFGESGPVVVVDENQSRRHDAGIGFPLLLGQGEVQ